MEPPRNRNSNAQATTSNPANLPAMHDQRVALAGLLLGLHQAVLVALGVLELQRILRLDLDGDSWVEPVSRNFNSRSRRVDSHVVAALGTDVRLRSISAR